MEPVKEAAPCYDQMAIVEKYEKVIAYLYPIAQSIPRKHGVAREMFLQRLLAIPGLLYAAANSGTADYTLYRANGSSFEGMVNSGGANPVSATAIARLKALVLFPVAPSGLGADGFYLNVSGERLPLRGSGGRDADAGIGARPAFVL